LSECALCDGIGLVKTDTGSRACVCQETRRLAAGLTRARIPAGFMRATLGNFKPAAHTAGALRAARQFVDEFVPGMRNPPMLGLLLTGTVGTGKTHVAVGVLRELVERQGIEARFVDVRELLDRLRSSYDDHAAETHGQIMRRVTGADLVVIDELGAARPSDWVFETIELLIGGLYNSNTPAIVTTNLPNLGPGAGGQATNEYARAARPETLGDRIGARMWSRLQQMCGTVEMNGPDYRGKR
jgi:DNA replication protein DnaC